MANLEASLFVVAMIMALMVVVINGAYDMVVVAFMSITMAFMTVVVRVVVMMAVVGATLVMSQWALVAVLAGAL